MKKVFILATALTLVLGSLEPAFAQNKGRCGGGHGRNHGGCVHRGGGSGGGGGSVKGKPGGSKGNPKGYGS